jgi:tetratricopeptide (TPR) repeat protein
MKNMDISEDIQLAVQLYQEKKLLQARDTCRRILEVESENIVALHLLGVLLYELEEYGSSIETLGKALKLNSLDPYLYYNYGASLHKQGLVNDAKTSYEDAIRLKSDFSEAYFNLGIILEEMGSLDEAIITYKRALQYNPASLETYNNLGNLLHKRGKLNDAILYFNEALNLNPNYIHALNNSGKIFREKGELDKAVDFYQKAIELKLDCLDSYYNLTLTLIEQNEASKAIGCFRRALQENLGHIEIYNLLRNVLKSQLSHNMKFNIIIPKRNRKEYLLNCLHYLNLANENRQDDIEVYISHDDREVLDFSSFENLGIYYFYIQKEGHFNKSLLLNYAIKHARKDFDILTIMDLDIVYDNKFFEIIKYLVDSFDYIVTTGYRLSKEESKSIRKSRSSIDVLRKAKEYDNYAGLSQISMNRKAYFEILKASGREVLFNEYYEGWGCEDSELSAISTFLSQKGSIQKTMIHGMWYHVWHEIEKEKIDFDKELYERNVQYLNEFTKKYGF